MTNSVTFFPARCCHGRFLQQNRFQSPTMRTSIIRMAQAVNISSATHESLQTARSKLLPPMRSLGDDYVKAEFKRHKTADNPVHIMGFLLEWNQYLDQLQFQFGQNSPENFKGKRMDDTLFDKMSNEQLGQLYELMHASKNVWKPVTSRDPAGTDNGPTKS